MNRDFCTGCIFLGEDSLSCEIDWYYSCQNENSKNYLVREDDLEAFTKDGEVCPDKKLNKMATTKKTMNEKDYYVRQLVTEIQGELDYVERYLTKLKVKLVELEMVLNDGDKNGRQE